MTTKLPRHKSLVFFNNKGGVGKTTLLFHTAIKLSRKGFKVALIDLDPQCNLTIHALGEAFFNAEVPAKTAFDVFAGFVSAIPTDVDFSVPLLPTRQYPDVVILPGSMYVSRFDAELADCIKDANAGEKRGFGETSIFARFFQEKARTDEIDIFLIDCSPSFSTLNQVVLLTADYFVVPMEADCFSVQGVENLGSILHRWKESWKMGAIAQSKRSDSGVESRFVIGGQPIFIGYILNRCSQYAKNLSKPQRFWFNKIPDAIRKNLSEKHTKNGLVTSTVNAIGSIKLYASPMKIAQKDNKCAFDLIYSGKKFLPETTRNGQYTKASEQFDVVADKISDIIQKY